jgi:hypothetical protein
MPHGTSLATLVDVHVPRVPIQATMSSGQLTSGISSIVYPAVGIAGMVAWYDASQISGIASGTSLSTWTDLSGLGHHVTSSLVTQQPLYITNIQNGLPVVRFEGINTFLQGTFTLNQPETVAITFSYQTTATNAKAVFDGKTSTAMLLDNVSASIPATGGTRLVSGSAIQDIASTITNGNFYLMTGIFNNGSASTLFISSSFSTSGIVGTTGAGGFTLAARGGGGSNARVDIGEVAIFNVALTPTDRGILEKYLKAKWSTVT